MIWREMFSATSFAFVSGLLISLMRSWIFLPIDFCSFPPSFSMLAPLAPIRTPGRPVWMITVTRWGWRMISTSAMSAPLVSSASRMVLRSRRSSCRVAAYSLGSTNHREDQVLLIPSRSPIGLTF